MDVVFVLYGEVKVPLEYDILPLEMFSEVASLPKVGGLLDNKGYGIAVGKSSPISASELSEVILKMQEDGRLQQLKTLWWKNKKDGGKCVVS